MKFSSKVEACGYSPVRKFNSYQVACKKAGKKIYHLNIGQPDIKTPEVYMEAVRSFDSPVLAYEAHPGMTSLCEAMSKYYARIGAPYDPSEIKITDGGSEALLLIMLTLLEDGDQVMIPEPFYPNYSTFINITGASITPIKTTAEEGYKYAVREKLEAAYNPKVKAMLFTNPGNPTGVVLTKDELQVLADFAKDKGIFLIGDEVYREFVYDGQDLTSIAQYPEVKDQVILVDSVSKRFSACGARVGAILTTNKEFLAQLDKLLQARLCVPTLDQLGATALYGLDPGYFEGTRAEYKKRRDVAFEALQKIPGIVCKQPMGAFYIMAKLPVDDTEKFLIWMLTEFEDNGETAMFTPAAGFYATPGCGVDEIRLAYVLNADDLKRGIELMGKGIEKYNSLKK